MKRWLPIAGVGTLVATTFGVLQKFMPDPYGANLSNVVQATATVALLGVTFLYVIATQDLANSTRDQVRHQLDGPERDAAAAAWEMVYVLGQPQFDLIRRIKSLLSASELAATEFGAVRALFEQLFLESRKLTDALRTQFPRLPQDLLSVARIYGMEATRLEREGAPYLQYLAEVLDTGHAAGAILTTETQNRFWKDYLETMPRAERLHRANPLGDLGLLETILLDLQHIAITPGGRREEITARFTKGRGKKVRWYRFMPGQPGSGRIIRKPAKEKRR
jgi:hypothetical protein